MTGNYRLISDPSIVDAEYVKRVREETGAGMLDVRNLKRAENRREAILVLQDKTRSASVEGLRDVLHDVLELMRAT